MFPVCLLGAAAGLVIGMNANTKWLLIIAAICFALGALSGLLGMTTPINWTNAGLCFITCAKLRGEW